MMKQFLLLVSLLCCVGAWGQSLRTAVFNFSDPASLNPSYPASAFETEAGRSLKVSDDTFTANGVSLSFSDLSNSAGVWIQKFNEGTYAGTYWLMPKTNSYVIFTAPDGGYIESIEVAKGSLQGNFSLANGQKGSFDEHSQDYCCKWTADGGSYQTVKFFTSGEGSQFNKITVTYKPRADVLTPTATSIANGATVGSFSSIDLTFGSNISLQSGVKATLASSDGKTTEDLTAAVSGSKLTLSLAKAITDDGTYTITVPTGLVETSDGYINTALSYTITVKKDRATFNPIAVSPKEGYVGESFPSQVTITFPDYIGNKVSEDALVLKLNGESKAAMTFKVSEDGKSIVGTVRGGRVYTDLGTYSLTLPEKFVCDNLYGTDDVKWNKEVTFSWNVTDKKPDTETMKAAKVLLKKTGVGYPSAMSAARVALSDSINAKKTPADSTLLKLMDNFYKETDVELPTADKYYKIYGVNAKGDKLYLTYDGSAVKLSSSEGNAYSFKAEAKGKGKVAFSTLDGKYLHVLMNSDDYPTTSNKNVTESYSSDVNDLTLNKLKVDKVSDKATFGLFSVYGYLGEHKRKKTKDYANALIDFSINTIETDPTDPKLYFTDADFSSAFAFEESTKPAVDSVDIDAKLDKDTIKTASDVIRLSFTKDDNVVLKDGVVPSVTDKDGKAVAGVSATIKAVENSTMDFDISFSGLTEGTYYLVIPKGAFSFVEDNKQVTSKEYKAKFTFSTKSTPTPTPTPSNFQHYYGWTKLPAENRDEYPKDYLEQYIVLIDRAQTDSLIGNPNAKVELKETINGNLMGVGHFEFDKEHTDATNYALKLVWDEPIDLVKVRTTQYTFIIPEGAFGDANYGKYLKNSSSVASSACTVNDSYTKTYDINSELAGIDNIQKSNNAPKVIYDLQGRRVERVTKTGIYIVNGKKMVIWK